MLTQEIIPNDSKHEFKDKNNDPKSVIAKVEKYSHHVERGKNSLKHLHGNDRHYANLLHRKADQHYLREDYETALKLHHKAVNIYPSDRSHSVAVRGTTSAISSTVANPSSALGKLLPKVQNGAKLSATLSPSFENIVKKSTESVDFPEILECLDRRADMKKLPMSNNMAQRLSRTQMMHRQLLNQANSTLTNLKEQFLAGNDKSTLKLAQDVIFLASGLEVPYRYLVEAYRCLALIHVSQRRHDRAVNNVSQMINAARASGDMALFTDSLVILGVVHVTFHHYDALSHAWHFLLPEVNHLVPRAWILHEIGRCHFECERFTTALQFSQLCQEMATRAKSKKWLRYGQLLSGQSLLKIGRFEEALKNLKHAGIITEEEGDTPTLEYIKNLINQVRGILTLTMDTGEGVSKQVSKGASIDSSRDKSSGSERKILKDRHQPFSDAFSSSPDKMSLDNEISSIKIDRDDHSITTSTHIVTEDFDLDSIASTDSDRTYVIRKDQYQTPTENSSLNFPSSRVFSQHYLEHYPQNKIHSHADLLQHYHHQMKQLSSTATKNFTFENFEIGDRNRPMSAKNKHISISNNNQVEMHSKERNVSKNSFNISIFPEEEKLHAVNNDWRLFFPEK